MKMSSQDVLSGKDIKEPPIWPFFMIAFCCIIIALSLGGGSCQLSLGKSDPAKNLMEKLLPVGSTIIENLGNKNFIVEFRGKKYLARDNTMELMLVKLED
jgi:hypothetical protein